jgi:dihydrofolate synthase / folylpolyglutamate synthase
MTGFMNSNHPSAENYEQAIEYLFSRVNFERLVGSLYTADDFKLDRMRTFLERLGDPQESIPAVHIAGTKGKGSTAAFVASILTAAGIRTGLFTSPHISAFEERLAVDGAVPAPGELAELVNSVSEVVSTLDKAPGRMSPTYFEIATALAWQYFRRRSAELAVLEVGMGGRLDATNVCRPIVTAITTISRDHTRHLGSRLDQIAREKAGIIKPGVGVVSGVTAPEAQAVIADVCREQQARLLQIGRDFDYQYIAPVDGKGARVTVRTWRRTWNELPLPLVGEHQAANAAVAISALEVLVEEGWQIPPTAFGDGLARVRWPGRIEIVARRPTVIVDTAHNWAAIAALLRTLDESFPARRRVLIFAATRDKDVAGMMRQLLPKFDSIVLTCFQNNTRSVPADELQRLAHHLCDRPVHTVAEPAAAWRLARRFAGAEDLICVTGSFFIAAELRDLILDSERQSQPASLPRMTVSTNDAEKIP